MFGYITRVWVIQTNPGDLFRAQACERCAEWQQALSLLDDTSLHNHSKWKATLRRCCNLVVVTFTIFCLHVFMLLYVWSLFFVFRSFKWSQSWGHADCSLRWRIRDASVHLCLCQGASMCIFACWSRSRCFLQEGAIKNLIRQAKQSQMAAILLRKADLSRQVVCTPTRPLPSWSSFFEHRFS